MSIVQKTVSPRAWAELSALGLIWGASFLSIRIALDEVGPFTLVLHRTGWAMLALWAVVAARRLPLPRDPRIWGAFLVMGLLNNAIPFSLMAWGQQHIATGLTSIFNAATAIFGVVLAALVFADERLSPRKAVGVAVGFAGVSVAIGPEALLQFDLASAAQLAVLGGALSYGLAGCWGRARLGALPPLVSAAGMLTGSTLLMLPVALMTEGTPTLALEPRTWGALAYVSLVATAFAYLLYWRVLAMAGSGNLMLVTLMIPPVAIGLGALVLSEALPPRALMGFAMLALGLAVIDGRIVKRMA